MKCAILLTIKHHGRLSLAEAVGRVARVFAVVAVVEDANA